jgi:hypothetical protein
MKPRKIAINGRGAVVDLATGDKSAA